MEEKGLTRRCRLSALSGLGDVHGAYFPSRPVFARRSLEALRGLPSFLPSFHLLGLPLFAHTKKAPLLSLPLPCARLGGSRSGGVGERPIVRPHSCRAGTDHVWKGLLPCCRASGRKSGHTGCERGLPPFLLSSLPSLSLFPVRRRRLVLKVHFRADTMKARAIDPSIR